MNEETLKIKDDEYIFAQAEITDLQNIMKIISSSLTREFCPWNENYPTESDIRIDILNGDGYCLKKADKVVAYISRDRNPEEGELPLWTPELNPGAEISRLVVAEEFENRGIARIMIISIMDRLKRMGFKSCRYLVAENNIPAIRSYKILEFNKVGETDLFDNHFICYEKEL